MNDPRYRSALLRYARVRRLAYGVAREDAIVQHLAGEPLRIVDIDRSALATWKREWDDPHPRGDGGWDWTILAERFRTDPAVFKPALWYGDVLCGMALGRPSHRTVSGHRDAISVHYMEGNPDPAHPLKGRVAALLGAAAEVYGRNLGASRLRLIDPLPGVIRLYVALGFAIARTPGGIVYCEKEIS